MCLDWSQWELRNDKVQARRKARGLCGGSGLRGSLALAGQLLPVEACLECTAVFYRYLFCLTR